MNKKCNNLLITSQIFRSNKCSNVTLFWINIEFYLDNIFLKIENLKSWKIKLL